MIKLLNKFYKWRGTGDKLDNIPIFIFFGLVLGSIIPIDALFFMSIFSARAFFPLYYYYDNMFLSVLFFPFFAYFHFTLLSLIIHKFDLSWLKNKGWKRYIDFIFFIWFSFILGAIINKFFPDIPGFDLFDIILISLLILLLFYRVLNSKRLQKIYFDDLKKMKEDGKITDEKYQDAIATNIIARNIFKRGIYEGTFISEEGEYVGQFKNGKFHGQGTFTYKKDGAVYVGEWKDNKPHGQGVLTYSDGKVEKGIWKDGEIDRF